MHNLVKTEFLHKSKPLVKFHHLRKSGEIVEGRRFTLCEPKMNIHNPQTLWKTLVEKPVDNVENYEFSTGIPAF